MGHWEMEGGGAGRCPGPRLQAPAGQRQVSRLVDGERAAWPFTKGLGCRADAGVSPTSGGKPMKFSELVTL